MDRRPFSLFTYSYSSHVARQSPPNSTIVGTTSVGLLYLFLSFQLVDQISLLILVATFLLSKTVKRHPTVVNVCVTWIISGTISSLLLYAGKQTGPEPPNLLCASQAALLDGVPPMTSVGILALLYQLHLCITRPTAKSHRMRTYALIVAPYLCFFGFSVTAAFLAVQRPEAVNRARRFFYCSFESPITNVLAIFAALILLTTLGYAVAIAVFLRRNWRALRQAGSLDLQFLGRVAVFVLYVFINLILSVLSISAPKNPFPDLFLASAGTTLAIILASQPDVYRAWLCRSKSTPPPITDDWLSQDLEKVDSDKLRVLEKAHITKGGYQVPVLDISEKLEALHNKSQPHLLYDRDPSASVEAEENEDNIGVPAIEHHFVPQGGS